MSYYNLFEVDIIQTSQLYLGGGVNQPNPSSGLVLYSDGLGGTYWSTVSGGNFSPQTLTSTVDGLGTVGYASTTYVTTQISSFSTALGTVGSGNLTTSNLISTVIGLGTSGYISSQQLQSTVVGLNTYISSFIDTRELTSTIVGLGTYGYFSTIGIYSTVSGLYNFIQDDIGSTIVGLGTAGFISTIGLDAKLASTTAGLGTAGYASTIAVQQLSNYTKNILQDFSTGLSTVALFTSNTSNFSRGILQDFSTPLSTVALFTSNTSNYYSNLLAFNISTSLQSTAIGLGTLGYISTAQLLSTVLGINTYISSFVDMPELTSTLIGLGTFGYFSTIGIYSTVTGLYNFIQDDIGSTIVGLGTAGFVSTIGLDAKLASTTNGLGTAGYISSLPNTVSTPFLNSALASTTIGLGTAGYISSLPSIVSTPFLNTVLVSTTIGLGTAGFISSPQLLSTVLGLNTYISSFIDTTELTSTLIGLGTFGYFSTIGIYSTVTGLYNFIQADIGSTIVGLGTAGFISTIGLDAKLASTTNGLGTAGYISSQQLQSTTLGLQQFISTQVAIPANTTGTVLYLNYSTIVSPYRGLGIATTSNGQSIITTTLPGATSNTPITQFQTNFELPTFIPPGIWDVNVFAISDKPTDIFAYANLYTRTSGGIESLLASSSNNPTLIQNIVDTFYDITLTVPYTFLSTNTTLVLKLFGNNNDSAARTITTYYEGATYSHIHTTFGTLLPNDVLNSTVMGLGTAGYVSTIAFQQLSNYTRNILQDWSTSISTVALFTSNTSNFSRNILQDYSTAISTVALFTSNTSNFARGILQDFSTPIISTVIGLGTAGYASTTYVTGQISSFSTSLGQIGSGNLTTSNLTSTVIGLGTSGYISSPQLLSTVLGLNTYISSFIDTTELTSTLIGLGTFGYFSTIGVYSTVTGLYNFIQDDIGSTIVGLGTAGYFSTLGFDSKMASTVAGLGTAGYVSTIALQQLSNYTRNILQDFSTGLSTVALFTSNTSNFSRNILQDFSTGLSTVALFTSNTSNFSRGILQDFSTPILSTVIGLGTAGYASTSYVTAQISSFSTSLGQIGSGNLTTANLTSTVIGLGNVGYISSSQLRSTVSGIYTSMQQTQIAPSDYVANGRLSGDTSLAPGTTTIPFVDDFDPQNWFNTTNYRFQPTIQGYYSVSLAAWLSGIGTAPANQYNIQIINPAGNTLAIAQQTQTSTFGISLEVTKTLFFNGSTDYITFTVFNGTNVSQTMYGGTSPGGGTWYSAFLIASGTTSGWITSTNLTSTVIGLGTAGYASTSYVIQEISSFSTSLGQIGSGNLTTSNLASTVVGLGTVGYISSSQLTSTVSGIYVRMQQPQLGPTDFIAQGRLSGDVSLPTNTTLIAFIDQYDPQNWFNTSTSRFQPTIAGYYCVSLAVWLSSVASAPGQYNIQILDSAGTTIAINQTPQGSVSGVTLEITKIIYFNGTTDYITFTVYNGNAANQTMFAGNSLGSGTWYSAFLIASGASAGLVTSTSLLSTVAGLGTAGYASTSYVLQQISSFSTSLGQIGSGNLTTANLASTVVGLGTAGYISSQQLQSTVQGLTNFTSTNYIDVPELTSSLVGLGTLSYISAPTLTVFLVSTTQGLGTIGYVSSQQLQSTTIGFTTILRSSIIGLGTAGYASTTYVTQQISSFSTAIATAISQGGISQANLTSSLVGLGTFGFISSPQLISTVVGIGNIYISTGGGGTGDVTKAQLISTTVGLGNIYISTAGGGSGDVTSQQLQSTTRGLGTALYASTKLVFICTQGEVLPFPPINFPTVLNQDWSTPVSTVALFTSNTSNFYYNSYINNYSTPLFSTVIGLGSANYASTSLVYIPNVSTQAVLPFPTIGVFPLSTVSAPYATFSSLTSETSYIGLFSSINAIKFYGLEGTYDRTVIAERTISEATQELLLFKGSTTTENIRLQTTGSILFETGVSGRTFDTATQVSTPTLTITNTNQVGINCNAPSFTLDISGSLNVSGPFSSRLRIVASTITTSQTITVNDIGAFFFYTTSTPLLSINMPTPADAGNGWNVTIQNTPDSIQVITVQTTPPVVLSQSITRRFMTDGNSWYFI